LPIPGEYTNYCCAANVSLCVRIWSLLGLYWTYVTQHATECGLTFAGSNSLLF